MPASPITKTMNELPDNWVHLQKTIIPDTETSCYWSVWFDGETYENRYGEKFTRGTAWLMWCPFGDNPAVNDNWGHVEEMMGDCKNVLTTIEKVFGVSFHNKIQQELPSECKSCDAIAGVNDDGICINCYTTSIEEGR